MKTKRKDCFLIQRIEKLENGWKFYPASKPDKPIFISKQNFSGKLPKKFKFFWQKHKFEYEHYDDFICSASLDDNQLFVIPEDYYPEDIKKDIQAFQKLYQKYLEKHQQENERLKKDLTEYVCTTDKFSEDEISTLRIPLRAYLKLHLFKGKADNLLKRLSLMLSLCRIAERIYKRHVKETDKKYSLDLDCTFAVLRFCPFIHDDIWPDQHFDMIDMENAVGKEKTHETYETYYEAEQLIAETLPATDNILIQRYLNYLVRKLLWLFAEDWNTLQSNAKRNASGLRACTDEQDYEYQHKKMKLLHHTNFILLEEFSLDTIDSFINNYSLA